MKNVDLSSFQVAFSLSHCN